MVDFDRRSVPKFQGENSFGNNFLPHYTISRLCALGSNLPSYRNKENALSISLRQFCRSRSIMTALEIVHVGDHGLTGHHANRAVHHHHHCVLSGS